MVGGLIGDGLRTDLETLQNRVRKLVKSWCLYRAVTPRKAKFRIMSRSSSRKRSATSSPVRVNDYELFDPNTGVHTTVFGEEILEVAASLAAANGVPAAELLVNKSIPAGQKLSCCTAQHVPSGLGWRFDEAGYVLVKLKRSSTVVGHTFLGQSSSTATDQDFVPTSRAAVVEATSPPRRRRRSVGVPGWLKDLSQSPESPNQEAVGRTQPLPIRWHRAAALAISADPEADSKLVVRHVCGNKRCLEVSHFKFGSMAENEQDEEYHRMHAGCSREAWPKAQ